MKEDQGSYKRNSFADAKRKPEKFLFATAKVASITAMIFFHVILHPVVLIYDFPIFITSFLLLLNQNCFAVQGYKNLKSGILLVVWNHAM